MNNQKTVTPSNPGILPPTNLVRKDNTRWKAIVAEFQKPNALKASWQILNSIGSYLGLWVVMYFTMSISWWLTIPIAILAGGLLVRVFIIFHDCGHGSFFRSKRANSFWGFFTGLLTFTPYYHWKWSHSVHHAISGKLDEDEVDGIWTMTVEDFLNASRWKRFSYRLARNPFILFVVAPLYVFLVHQRFSLPQSKPIAKRSVWKMNFALVAMGFGMSAIYGFLPWLIIQLVIVAVAGSIGIWLFYVQHQFEDAYWERNNDWDYVDAALKGSSYYKLPKILQWFTGNIGFHHIHHLSSRIPNYNLESCHRSDPMFEEVQPLTMWQSLKTMTVRLWDENAKRMISFKELRRQRRMQEEVAEYEPSC